VNFWGVWVLACADVFFPKFEYIVNGVCGIFVVRRVVGFGTSKDFTQRGERKGGGKAEKHRIVYGRDAEDAEKGKRDPCLRRAGLRRNRAVARFTSSAPTMAGA
jgi:hypothetical protein